jgi:hypothetical protein
MKTVQLDFHDEFSSVAATLPQEYATTIQHLFS